MVNCGAGGKDGGRAGGSVPGAGSHGSDVTPVSGESWLKHLGLVPSQTEMGEMGGLEPPGATARQEPGIAGSEPRGGDTLHRMMGRFMRSFGSDQAGASQALAEPFKLAGEDLYRLNCQSCHGPDGQGAPPEIKSLLDPVRGASPAMLEQRMKKLGHPIGRAMAEQLAAQGEAAIRKRLADGGEKMPPFRHLRGDEIDALLGYLGALAGVPATGRTGMLVDESAARVGEHLVKGTCHICHDATGPGGGHMAMMRGVIPSLASFPQQLSLSVVERQVTYGSPPMMGMMMGGERMPALPYITGDETAAGYFYLVAYPPHR
jgi:mono/diheme cytochrome c family protein